MKKTWVFVILGLLLVGLVLAVIFYPVNKQYGDTINLLDAINAEDRDEVERLLLEGVDPNKTDIPPSNYWSFWEISARRPLAIACGTGNLEIVQLLIEYGATAEHIDYTSWSPLRNTVFYYDADDVQIVKLLLANGADPDVEETEEHTVFTAAEMYPMLLGSEDFLTGYDEEIGEDITEIVQMLMVNQNIDLQSPWGRTVLMCAAMRGNVALAEYCIEQGCDVYLKNDQGQTAYDIAVKYGKQEIAALLEEAMCHDR